MLRIAFASLAALCACASSSSTPGTSAAPQTIRVGTGGAGGKTTISATTTAHVSTVPFPLALVWRVLPAAYDALAIPMAQSDAKSHVVGSDDVKVRQRLGDTPLSRFIECGTTQIGPNADSYDVYLNVITQVEPATAGTAKISTTVDAAARPISFAQEYSRCTSKGVLEQRIVEMVKARLQP